MEPEHKDLVLQEPEHKGSVLLEPEHKGLDLLEPEHKSPELLKPEEHLPLHPVLELAPPHHGEDDLGDGPLRVLLLHEVIEDGVLRHLAAHREPFLELLLHPLDDLLVLLRREPLGSGQLAGHSRAQGRHLRSINQSINQSIS